MEKERQQRVYELLKRGLKLIENGDELPVEWAREFFPPERREYELIYHGKESEEKILADAMAVPLQPVSTFGTNGIDWHNMLILGDNLQAMKTLLQMKDSDELVNADGTPGVRLIYIDPPFGTGDEYSITDDLRAYSAKLQGSKYIEFLRKRLFLLRIDDIVDNPTKHPYFYISSRVFMAMFYRHVVAGRKVREGDSFDQYYLIYLANLDYLISEDGGLKELGEDVFGKTKVINLAELIRII